ncbi:MAG: DUF2202 domain-containing protein [Saprospiraceae bacterium]|nr:DUF2202 domain-containing protein [Saprospiraceae bacterium]
MKEFDPGCVTEDELQLIIYRDFLLKGSLSKDQIMKTTINFFSMLVLAMFAILSFSQCQKDANFQEMHQYALNDYGTQNNGVAIQTNGNSNTVDVCECLTNNFSIQDVNEAEKEALVFMREEEKLARDVYQYFYEKYNYRVFNNITRSETRHMETILCLVERYGLTDPVQNNDYGIFQNQELATLYQNLIEQGSQSLNDALAVGALIEDLDINDLMTLSESGNIDNEDILAVFGELTRGSRNHLRAFVKNLNQYGENYAPVYISQDYFAGIINSDRERGTGLCAEAGSNCQNNQNCTGDGPGTCDQECDGTQQGTGNQQGHGQKGGPN